MLSRCLPLLFRQSVVQSLAGFLVWLFSVAIVQPGWAPALLQFGPLVLFPLLFDIADEGSPFMRRALAAAFLPVVVSYACEPGIIAAVLTLPWLLFTIELFGHRLFVGRASAGTPHWSLAPPATTKFSLFIIKGYLIVGAAWLTLARFGARPLGFEPVIVHATAMHFHYAGFVLPLLAMRLFREAPGRGRSVLLVALLAGMPLVAIGITLAQLGVAWVETAAACAFSAACIGFAITQLRFGILNRRPLLIASSLSLLAAMTLAILYAIRHQVTIEAISIDFMLRWHGPIQVFGFATLGIAAWMFEQRTEVRGP